MEAAETFRVQCAEWLKQATALRTIDVPARDAPPQEFYDALLKARGHLDSLERLLDNAVSLRGSTARALRDLHDATEDAWDKKAAGSRKHEFEGARERYAEFNLAVLEQRQTERQMARLADLAKETEDRIRLIHRGLNDVRQDCLSAIRFLQFESTLERSG